MPRSGVTFEARPLTPGKAEGTLLVLTEPLSFWGGIDPQTGLVIDRRHPQCGLNVRGTVLTMPAGRGSSSSSSVLAEAIRLDTAPCAIVLSVPDGILALGAIVAEELYGRRCPIVSLEIAAYETLRSGMRVAVRSSEDAATVSVVDP